MLCGIRSPRVHSKGMGEEATGVDAEVLPGGPSTLVRCERRLRHLSLKSNNGLSKKGHESYRNRCSNLNFWLQQMQRATKRQTYRTAIVRQEARTTRSNLCLSKPNRSWKASYECFRPRGRRGRLLVLDRPLATDSDGTPLSRSSSAMACCSGSNRSGLFSTVSTIQ